MIKSLFASQLNSVSTFNDEQAAGRWAEKNSNCSRLLEKENLEVSRLGFMFTQHEFKLLSPVLIACMKQKSEQHKDVTHHMLHLGVKDFA